MSFHRTTYRNIGLGLWVAVLIAALVMAWSLRGNDSLAMGRWIRSATRSPQRVKATDPSGRMERGDCVFVSAGHTGWSLAGYVESCDANAGTVTMVWYAQDDPAGYRWTQHWQSGNLQEVVTTLLPAEKREQIQRRLAAVARQHGQEISAVMLPLMQEGLRQSLVSIETEFRASIARHQTEIDALADRWNHDLIENRLVPLVKQEVIPIVRKHVQPEAESIGRELWGRASLWRFGWKAIYDKSPLPRRDLVRREWEKFTEEEVAPVIEDHADQIVAATQRTLQDIAANQKIRQEIQSMTAEIASDPETRQLVKIILRESIVENQQLHQTWRDIWSSDQAQAAFETVSNRLEPAVRSIVDDLFGSRESGIDPNFAKVLRNQILGKDRRWIVATRVDSPRGVSGTGDQLAVIELARQRSSFPLLPVANSAATTRPSSTPQTAVTP